MFDLGFPELVLAVVCAAYVALPVALLVLLLRIQRSVERIEQHLALHAAPGCRERAADDTRGNAGTAPAGCLGSGGAGARTRASRN